MFPCNVYSNFTQPFLLTTISNSSNYNFELNHDFELACLSMLMVIINPVLTSTIRLNDIPCPKIISDGYMYGRVCSTGGQYIALEGVGECHSQTTPAEFKQEERIENATHIYSRYGVL